MQRSREDDRSSASDVFAGIWELKELFHRYLADTKAEIAELEKVIRRFEITDEALAESVRKDDLATWNERGKSLILFLPILNNGGEVLVGQKVRVRNVNKNILAALKQYYLK